MFVKEGCPLQHCEVVEQGFMSSIQLYTFVSQIHLWQVEIIPSPCNPLCCGISETS